VLIKRQWKIPSLLLLLVLGSAEGCTVRNTARKWLNIWSRTVFLISSAQQHASGPTLLPFHPAFGYQDNL